MRDKINFSDIEDFLNEHDVCEHDKTKKEIGDRIILIDFSSVTRFDGSELYIIGVINDVDNDHVLNVDYFIVAETRQKYEYKSVLKTYVQDLVIANSKTNQLYRVNSGHVKQYEKNLMNK